MTPHFLAARPRAAFPGSIVHSAPVVTVALLALLHAAPAAAAGWTLDRTLGAVRAHDPRVRAAMAAGDAGRAQAAQNWAYLLPHVSLAGGFTRTDDPAMLFSQKLWQGNFTPADFAIEQLNQPSPASAYQWGLIVDQPLWNGGREFHAPAQAGRYSRAATAMERAEVADRLLDAVEAWVDAVSARDDERAASQALTAAEGMRAAAAERFRMGQVAEVDTLRTAARASGARVQAIAARRMLAVRLERLSQLVGEPVAADSLDSSDDVAGRPLPAPADRPELIAARESAAAAATASREAGMALLPSLNSRFAMTQYRAATNDPGWEQRWMVAVSAELPLFDGAQRWNQWKLAQARAAEASARAEAYRTDLTLALEAARTEDAVSLEARDAARAGASAAQAAWHLAEARYRAGLLPLTDLLAADAERSAALAAETQANAAATRSHYRLLHALGEMR